METELLNKIKYIAKKKKGIDEALDYLDMSQRDIENLIFLLNKQGERIILSDGLVKYDESTRLRETPINADYSVRDFKMCLISDTHLCTSFERLDILEHIYEKCERKGIKFVFHSGDIVEGTNTKGKDTSHLKENSFKGQFDYVIDKYPRYSGVTYLINGNHDLRWLKKDNKNMALELAKSRDDFKYLGDEQAIITFNGIKMLILHNIRENNIEYFDGDLVQQGHMHSSDLYFDHDIPHFQTAALIDLPPYAKAYKKKFERSCWFLTVSFDDNGNIYDITKELEKFNEDKKTLVKK